MENNAVTGLAKKVKLKNNDIVLVIYKTALGYYDEETEIFTDSLTKKQYKPAGLSDGDCFFNLVTIDDLREHNVGIEEYRERIENKFYYLVKEEDLFFYQEFDGDQLKETLRQPSENGEPNIYELVDDAFTTYENILEGNYSKEELYMLQAQLLLLNSNIEQLLGAVNEELDDGIDDPFVPRLLN